ncbi:MAG TPA: ATP-binding protein, partial [Acidimicrobiales bacterium]|nr:ATP-binding protein [Acidimicrobiales bacterium]
MGVLVDDLLLLARLDQGRPLEKAPVDLAAIASDAVADASVVEPDRPVTIDLAGPVVVIGDEMRLRQMVANLVRNAFDHTPALTPVFIRVEPEGDAAVLTVSDLGPGVSEEHRGRIFERFYRADPSRTRASGGAGLGLAIVASIAEAHGGSARLDGDNGKGATFVVAIPLATPISATTDDAHMEDESPLHSNRA